MTTPELFRTFHYPELRDLTLAFLTLSSSVLALSVVFADNITPTGLFKQKGRIVLFAAWCTLVLSLAVGGHGLFRLFIAADLAHGGTMIRVDPVFGGNRDFLPYATGVFSELFISGLLFVGGLALLGVTAFYRLFRNAKGDGGAEGASSAAEGNAAPAKDSPAPGPGG